MAQNCTRKISLLLFLVSACIDAGLAQNAKAIIDGRVIDSRHRPVAQATVSLFVSSDDQHPLRGVDRVVQVFQTDVDGRFRFSLSPGDSQQAVVFVTTGVPASVFAPLRPPFVDLSGQPLFPGETIHVKTNTDVNVGDLPISVHYKTVRIPLRDESVLKVLKVANCGRCWLQVRDNHGDLVASEVVPENSFDKQDSAITLALPQGIWGLAISVRGSDGPWTSVVEALEIDRVGGDLVLPFRRDDRRANKTAASAKRNQDAHLRLAELGIRYDDTSFIEHAGKCNQQAVELFLAAGTNPNVNGNDGTSALLLASAGGCSDVVSFLLQAGADPNTSNSAGTSPLLAAVAVGSRNTVEALLAKNANANAWNKKHVTPLIIAAGNSRVDIVRLLLRAAADVNLTDNTGQSAFDYALMTGDRRVIQALKSVGAKSGKQ